MKIKNLAVLSVLAMVLSSCNINASSITQYKIVWENYDGTVLYKQKVSKGQLPSYNGATPVRESDSQFKYTFSGWSPEIEEATKSTKYVAQYESSINPDGYTVLIYMCGADLESDLANKTYVDGMRWNGQGLATMDIVEILSVKNKPSDVNIVIETGGASAWTKAKYGKYGDYDISSTKLQRHHVTSSGTIELDQELNYTSMGASSTLQSFLEFGLNTYPATKTALILWNHGGGLQGVCFDEKKNSDGLTAPEVINAVSKSLTNTNNQGKKLEWIGYDACLMAVQDNAELNSQYFNYMIASEETEAGYGWDYDTWVDDLYAHKDTQTVLKAICDGFIADNNYDDYGNYSTASNDQTLAFYDLSKVAAYKTAWENMAKQLKGKITSTNKSRFKSIITSTKYYGAETDNRSVYGLFDVKDFVTRLANNSTFNPGKTYTDAVLAALDDLVVYSACGAAAGNSNGLCMFWEYDRYTSYYNTYNSTTTTFTTWCGLSNSFGGQ